MPSRFTGRKKADLGNPISTRSGKSRMFKNISAWKLIRRNGTGTYYLRFTRFDGKVGERATKKTVKRQAERIALEMLVEIDQQLSEEVVEQEREIHGWHEFCRRYVQEHLAFGKPRTLEAFETARSRLSDLCPGIVWIKDVDEECFVKFALRLREEGKSPATIQCYRAHLLSALKWAKQVKLIDSRPDPPTIRVGSNQSRGRPITREEAERMSMQLPSIVGDNAQRWAWNLEALWRSGFRLGETFCFFWEETPGMHWIENLDARYPMVYISGESEKAGRDRLLPLAPDFVELLRDVPKKKRRGCVFRWTLTKGDSQSAKTVSKRIGIAGKQANVVVARKNNRVKYASAHEFRRSFGARYAPLVMPETLRCLMRHSSITTTMTYYTHSNAERLASALYAADVPSESEVLPVS